MREVVLLLEILAIESLRWVGKEPWLPAVVIFSGVSLESSFQARSLSTHALIHACSHPLKYPHAVPRITTCQNGGEHRGRRSLNTSAVSIPIPAASRIITQNGSCCLAPGEGKFITRHTANPPSRGATIFPPKKISITTTFICGAFIEIC